MTQERETNPKQRPHGACVPQTTVDPDTADSEGQKEVIWPECFHSNRHCIRNTSEATELRVLHHPSSLLAEMSILLYRLIKNQHKYGLIFFHDIEVMEGQMQGPHIQQEIQKGSSVMKA